MSSPPETVDVVIVGAGPTGLLLACQLTMHGVKYRIFDRSADHTTQSRAITVHARTLEIFDQMGIAEEAVERGEIVRSLSGFFNGVLRLNIDMKLIRTQNVTKFPFILMLEQSKTEEILEQLLERHGVIIDRQCELVDFTEQSDGEQLTEVTMRDYRRSGNDNLIRIRTKYICGCDGAHSRVRDILKLSFSGETYSDTLFVLDCSVKFLDRNNCTVATTKDAQFNLTREGIGLLFPLKDGADRWRVIGTVPYELVAKQESLQFEDIERNFSSRMQRNIQLYNPAWISAYRTHHRYARTFSIENRYFLLGDAAHIHSPVGGQGMNTGLQDAFNLAWKLAYTIQGKTASDSQQLLQTYNDERIAVAKKLVNSSDRVFAFATSQNPFLRFFRLIVLPFIIQFIVFPLMRNVAWLREVSFRRLSMIDIQYRQSELSETSGNVSKIVQAGDRLPYLSTPLNLEDKDARPLFQLLVLGGERSEKVLLFINFVKRFYSHLVKVHQFAYSPETLELFHVFGVNGSGGASACFLVRPDLYIGYCSTTFDTHHFDSYFSKYFRKQAV